MDPDFILISLLSLSKLFNEELLLFSFEVKDSSGVGIKTGWCLGTTGTIGFCTIVTATGLFPAKFDSSINKVFNSA